MWWELPPLYKTSHIFLAWSSLVACLWFSVNQIMTWLDLAYWVIEHKSYLTGKKIYFSCWQDRTFQALVVITLKTHIFTFFAKLHNIFLFQRKCLAKPPFWLSKTKMLSLKNVLCLVVNVFIVNAKFAYICRLIAAVKMWLRDQAWTILLHVFRELTVICSSALCLATLLFYTVIT